MRALDRNLFVKTASETPGVWEVELLYFVCVMILSTAILVMYSNVFHLYTYPYLFSIFIGTFPFCISSLICKICEVVSPLVRL